MDEYLRFVSVIGCSLFLEGNTFIATFAIRFGSLPFHPSILKPHLHLKIYEEKYNSKLIQESKEILNCG